MTEKYFVIYDSDEVYGKRLQQFLYERESNYFEIIAFSERKELEEKYNTGTKRKPEILLVAENSFYEDIIKVGAKHIFILNETGLKKYPQYTNFSKYQAANVLFQQILLEYAEKEQDFVPRFYGNKKAKLIGVYTPITRCLQTGFSFALAQSFGKRGKTLYMNFEQYSGFSKLFQKGYLKDLSDLVYYFSYSKDKFLYWLEGVVEHFGDIDYVPPVLTAVSLTEVKGNVWFDMFDILSKDGGYDYIVLDLNENVQGIFQILNLCQVVYTITRNDVISNAKICQFKEVLEESRFESVKKKIKYLELPGFSLGEAGFKEMLHSELQKYADQILETDFYGQSEL